MCKKNFCECLNNFYICTTTQQFMWLNIFNLKWFIELTNGGPHPEKSGRDCIITADYKTAVGDRNLISEVFRKGCVVFFFSLSTILFQVNFDLSIPNATQVTFS